MRSTCSGEGRGGGGRHGAARQTARRSPWSERPFIGACPRRVPGANLPTKRSGSTRPAGRPIGVTVDAIQFVGAVTQPPEGLVTVRPPPLARPEQAHGLDPLGLARRGFPDGREQQAGTL